MISIDTVSEGGVIGPSADGNIDDPQFKWLEGELKAVTKADELVILFSHHAIPSLTTAVPDEAAPPCAGPQDPHGHDVNPGCDLDPRVSEPIHLGDDVEQLLFEHPHVIAWIAGHSHVNSIEAHANPGHPGGFWSIRVAAEADWPQQARLVELFDNRDGTLSLFGTIVDQASAPAAPAPGPASSTRRTGARALLTGPLRRGHRQGPQRRAAGGRSAAGLGRRWRNGWPGVERSATGRAPGGRPNPRAGRQRPAERQARRRLPAGRPRRRSAERWQGLGQAQGRRWPGPDQGSRRRPRPGPLRTRQGQGEGGSEGQGQQGVREGEAPPPLAGGSRTSGTDTRWFRAPPPVRGRPLEPRRGRRGARRERPGQCPGPGSPTRSSRTG